MSDKFQLAITRRGELKSVRDVPGKKTTTKYCYVRMVYIFGRRPLVHRVARFGSLTALWYGTWVTSESPCVLLGQKLV